MDEVLNGDWLEIPLRDRQPNLPNMCDSDKILGVVNHFPSKEFDVVVF